MNNLNSDLKKYFLAFLGHDESVQFAKVNREYNKISKEVGYIKEVYVNRDEDLINKLSSVNKTNIQKLDFKASSRPYNEPIIMTSRSKSRNIMIFPKNKPKWYKRLYEINIFNIFRNNISLILNTNQFPSLEIIKFYVCEDDNLETTWNTTENIINVNYSNMFISNVCKNFGDTKIHIITIKMKKK